MKRLKESKRIKEIEEEWNNTIEDLLYDWHWKEDLMHKEIGKRLDVPRPTITRWFKKLGIPSQDPHRITNKNLLNVGPKKGPRATPKPKKRRGKKVNKNFFKEWSEDMAYVLGYFVADGCIFINPRGSHYLEFDSTDRELIEKTRAILDSEHKIGVRKWSNPNWKPKYVLEIGSKEMFEDLEKLGFCPNKSNNLKFPEVPKEYFSHWVRGLLDGDGCVFFKDYSEEDNNLQGVLLTSFTSGSPHFLQGLKDQLQEYACVEGGSIYEKNRGFELSFSKHDSLKLFEFMYKGISSEKFLERKYNVFQKFLRYHKGT